MISRDRLLCRMNRQREYVDGRKIGKTVADTLDGLNDTLWKAAYDLAEPDKTRIVINAVICKKKMQGKWRVEVD